MIRRPFSVAIACAITAWLAITWLFPEKSELRPFSFPPEARWIAAADGGEEAQASAGFRLDFQLPPHPVERAWIAIAADCGMEVIVNGNPMARWDLYRPTRPFQSGHTAYGQQLRYEPPALSLNYPREYQWSDNANWKLPMFIDITTALITGERNALCTVIHARHEEPAFRLVGEIVFANGERLALNSNEAWKSIKTPARLFDREWKNRRYLADDWLNARAAEPRGGQAWRYPTPGIYEEPFMGQWLKTPRDGGRHTFATKWRIDTPFDQAFLRIACDAEYLIRVNGNKIRTLGGSKRHASEGEWIARPAGRRILGVSPERLDPDEAGSNYIGEEFLNPRHGDPTDNNYESASKPLDLSQDTISSETRGDLFRRAGEEKPERPTEADGMGEQITGRGPEQAAAAALVPDVTGIDLTHWLESGENLIEVVAIPRADDLLYRNAKPIRLAVDGALVKDGKVEPAVGPTTVWTCDGEVTVAGRQPIGGLMSHQFRRINQPAPAGRWVPFAVFAVVFFAARRGFLDVIGSPLMALGLVAFCGLLIEVTMRERSEQLWMTGFHWWRLAILTVGVGAAWFVHRVPREASPDHESHERPPTGYHRLALFAMLLLAFVARAWQLDVQALDDDEYASVQATLSIAQKGVPEIAPGIYYTRGPIYHYAASLFVIVFGDNIWALRMPAILAGVVSAFFTYLLGSRLLHSRSLGLASGFLIALHPFCIFTSHIARFYQQQQTLTVATVYFFVSGFVQKGPGWHRAAAVVSAALAILSQEISLLIAVPFGFCYALMARPESLRTEIKLGLTAGLAGAVIFLNLLVFKVVCLTRLDGISPNVESTLKPHFFEPLNFLSMWLGYSRLHVFLGVFSVIGILAGFRKRDEGMIATSFFLVMGIIGTVLLVTATGFRYQFSVLPLWVLTAAFGIRVCAANVAMDRGRPALICLGIVVMTFGVLSFSPWRILPSYDLRILGDSSSATAYVRAHLRKNDAVAITEPHPHAALLETGRADYDIAIPILYDFVYRDMDGKLIDRNGGAESMGRLGTLQRAMAKHDRIWILINREKFRTRGRNLRWEYPGARFDLFVRQNCRLAYRAYLWDVYLWDRTEGKFANFRAEPEGWND
ncbi:MAG: glycosyltransferase family 39 protein [Verrucomicrobiales bacterium]